MFGNKNKQALKIAQLKSELYVMVPSIVINEIYGTLNAKEVEGRNRVQRFNDACIAKFNEIDENINDSKYVKELVKTYKNLIYKK